MKTARIAWSMLASVLGMLSSSAWAGPIYLEMDGIPGESADDHHPAWIEVESFANGLRPARLILPARRSAAAEGAGLVGQISCRKRADKASPKLAEAVCQGTVFPKAKFEFVTAGSDRARFYRVELEEVLVTSFASLGGNDDRPTEELTLSFTRAKWVYTEFAGAGKALADHQLDWDFLRNEGGASQVRRGFSASAEVRPGAVLGIRWTPEPGRRYQLLRSQDPAGPYFPIREIEASATGEERFEELPAGRQLDFFLLSEIE